MDIKCVSTCTYESPLGNILLAADEIGLTGLWFERQKYFANTLPEAHISQETQILLTIPYGQTMTYGEIAGQMANQQNMPHMSAQAVGGAVGHNQVSIIIPCHRVVGTNGSLTGYAGGIRKKVALLELEHTDMSRFFLPKRGTAL